MKFKIVSALTALAVLVCVTAFADDTHTSTKFEGPKANKGSVSHSSRDGKNVLTLSDDFVIPDTPAPHWQVVDSQGHTYLLQRLKVKGDKYHKSITVPDYVHDVAKVQIYCAWAEVVLGEASFDHPVTLATQ